MANTLYLIITLSIQICNNTHGQIYSTLYKYKQPKPSVAYIHIYNTNIIHLPIYLTFIRPGVQCPFRMKHMLDSHHYWQIQRVFGKIVVTNASGQSIAIPPHNLKRMRTPFINTALLESQHGYVNTCPVKCGIKLHNHSRTSTAAPLKY